MRGLTAPPSGMLAAKSAPRRIRRRLPAARGAARRLIRFRRRDALGGRRRSRLCAAASNLRLPMPTSSPSAPHTGGIPPWTRREWRSAGFAARRGGYPRRGRCVRRGRRHREIRLRAGACPQEECKNFGTGLRSFYTLPAPRLLGAGLPRGPPPDAAGCEAGRTVAANMAEGGAVQDAPSTPRLSSGTPCAAIGFRRKANCRASLDARRGTRRAGWTCVRPPGLRAQPGARIARCCERADGRAPGWRSQPATDRLFDRPRAGPSTYSGRPHPRQLAQPQKLTGYPEADFRA